VDAAEALKKVKEIRKTLKKPKHSFSIYSPPSKRVTMVQEEVK